MKLVKTLFCAGLLALSSGSVLAADIVDTAIKAGSFKTLVGLIKQAGLVETLKSKGPFTVFAPSDEAFAKVPKETLEALGKDKAKLAAVLTHHVVAGKVMAKDVKPGSVRSVHGQDLRLDTATGVTINGARVVKADVEASNGVIHVIDAVLLPKF